MCYSRRAWPWGLFNDASRREKCTRSRTEAPRNIERNAAGSGTAVSEPAAGGAGEVAEERLEIEIIDDAVAIEIAKVEQVGGGDLIAWIENRRDRQARLIMAETSATLTTPSRLKSPGSTTGRFWRTRLS